MEGDEPMVEFTPLDGLTVTFLASDVVSVLAKATAELRRTYGS
ncbi:MAG: hypothetical protein ACO1OB_05630 [Archangium sp.]